MRITPLLRFVVALLAFAILPACIDRSLNVNDPDYPVDGYTIVPEWSRIDTSALRPMALYRIPFTLGKDSFKSLSARVSNPDMVDTNILAKELTNNRIALYTLAAGVCTLTIDGVHPNARHTTVTKVLQAVNPYRIQGDSLFGMGETGAFSLLPLPHFDAVGLDLRIGWELDTTPAAFLRPSDTFSLSFIRRSAATLRAILTDTLHGHSLCADSLLIRIPGHRPAIDSLRVITDTLYPGESPLIQIHASDADSGYLKATVSSERAGTWRDSFHLRDPRMYSSILTGTKALRDTGTVDFWVQIADSTGLVSERKAGRFVVKANPPVVRFNPDTGVIFLLPDIPQTLRVRSITPADDSITFVWNVDGEDTITTRSELTRVFLTQEKKVSNASVFGIDRFGFHGPTAGITIREELSAFDLRFTSDPPDSCHKNHACWTVKTTRADRVKEYHPLFYWELVRTGDMAPVFRDTVAPDGDSVSTLCLSALSIPGISLDSIDCIVSVVLRDPADTNRTSPVRVDSVSIRPFKPAVSIQKVLPRADSVAVGEEMTIRFETHDVNPGGRTDSVFWKRSGAVGYQSVPATDDTLALRWDTAGPISLLLWARDNDGEYSDTVRLTFEVVLNRPRIAGLSVSRPVVFALEACTLSVALERGILRSPIVKILWRCDDTTPSDTVTLESILPCSFANPGEKTITVIAVDARGDSSLAYTDTVTILSGRPSVIVTERPDSVPARIPANIRFALSDLKSTIDTVFWQDTTESRVQAIAMPQPDSSFSCTWTTPGKKSLKLWATDRLGDRSDTETVSVIVDPGRPRVTAIHCDTPNTGLWVNDQVAFTVSARDTNGAVQHYRILLIRQGGGDTLSSQGSANRIPLIIPIGNDGVYTLTAYARDDDSLWSEGYRHPTPLTVRAGKPVLTLIHPPSAWIFDTISIALSAFDTNGVIRTVICDWADGSLDTVVLDQPLESVEDTVSHGYTGHGMKRIIITARDDDSLISIDTALVEIRKGAPTVRANADTFVWYDNKGGIRGDTINFRAQASDSNGTVSKLVWILRGTLDTAAAGPDTVVTVADSLVAGYADLGFWAAHQTSRTFTVDSTYTSAVYAIDEDGISSVPDTFRWYIDAPRTFSVTGEALKGYSGDRRIFELLGGTAQDDSLQIVLQNVAQGDTNYLGIKIDMVIDSLTDFSNPATLYGDTISIGNDTGFVPVQRFRTKQNQSGMAYDSAGKRWLVHYRPALAEFSDYKQTALPTPFLFFRIMISCRTRSGALQRFISPISLQMSATLRFVP